MADYKGEKCIVCGKDFTEGEDIVVCPDCGTPYHRTCYEINSKCINEELHARGEEWKPTARRGKRAEFSPLPAAGEKKSQTPREKIRDFFSEEVIVCPKCGKQNPVNFVSCKYCGADLEADDNPYYEDEKINAGKTANGPMIFDLNKDYAGLDPREKMDGARIGNIAEFINPEKYKQNIFLILFSRFSNGISKISTNFACIFFPDLYFAYRKMWKHFALMMLMVFTVSYFSALDSISGLDIPLVLGQTLDTSSADYQTMLSVLTSYQEFLRPHALTLSNISIILNGLWFGVRVLLFFFANYLYYRFAIRNVKEIEGSCSGEELRYVLHARGGTSISNIVKAIAIRLFVYFGAVMAAVGTVSTLASF